MFRVRPEVNWMLIAVDSWPYIRGTLSPSPPGARRVRGPKSYTPTLYLFVQLRRRRSHRPERPPLPFRTDAPSPTNTRVAKKRSSPSSTNWFRFFFLHRVLTTSDFFFLSLSSHIFTDTLTALVLYDTFSKE